MVELVFDLPLTGNIPAQDRGIRKSGLYPVIPLVIRRRRTGSRKERRKYKNLCWRITEENAHLVTDAHLRAWRIYDLDHIVPIFVAYKLGIPEELIGSVDNLRIISHKENANKGIRLTNEAVALLEKWGY